jgi:DNA-binding Lrp family transcriptional regulator
MEDPVLEYKILDTVHENEGRMTQRHISEKLGRSVASVNFALRLLAVKGYIKITGSNPRNLRYHLTPQGVIQKSILAYNFIRRQSALYEEARKGLLGTLKGLRTESVKTVSVYGWTPFTDSAMLFLLSEGVQVSALYIQGSPAFSQLNRVPIRNIEEFEADCEVLVLLERLPVGFEERVKCRKLVCYPTE